MPSTETFPAFVAGQPPSAFPASAGDLIPIIKAGVTTRAAASVLVAGVDTSVDGHVPVWSGTTGNQLGTGLPVATSGNSTLVLTDSTGALAVSNIKLAASANFIIGGVPQTGSLIHPNQGTPAPGPFALLNVNNVFVCDQIGIESTDATTITNSVTLTGSNLNAGDTVAFALAWTGGSTTISYHSTAGGETPTQVAAFLQTAYRSNATIIANWGAGYVTAATANASGPLFAFYSLWPISSTLTIANATTYSSGATMTMEINGTATTPSDPPRAGRTTLDVNPYVSIFRQVPGRAAEVGDTLGQLRFDGQDNTGQNAGLPFGFGAITVTATNVTPGSCAGNFELLTPNGTFVLNRGVFVPGVATYPGVVSSLGVDEGAGTISCANWIFPGNAVVGTWAAAGGSTYAMFGNSALDQSVATNYALLQKSDGNTLLNAASSNLQLLTGNVARATLTAAGLFLVGFDTDQGGAEPVQVNGALAIKATTMIHTYTAFSNGAAGSVGTLTNAPADGNPTKWVPINDAGTTRYVPAW